MSLPKMSPLRARMIEDMKLAGLAASTQDSYIDAVVKLTAHCGRRRPDLLAEDEVRTHLVGMIDRGAARGTFKTNYYGLQFFYRDTLGRDVGMACAPSHDAKSVLQCSHDVGMGDLDAERRQLRLVHQSVDEPVQSGLPLVAAEVVLVGFVASGLDQAVEIESLLEAHCVASRCRTDTRTSGGVGLCSHRSTTNPR